MDLAQVFWTAIIMAVVAWLATALFHKNFIALLSTIGAALFIVPIIIISIRGYSDMQSVSSNLTAMNDVANKTITSITEYFGQHMPETIISNLAGTIVGVIAGSFIKTNNRG